MKGVSIIIGLVVVLAVLLFVAAIVPTPVSKDELKKFSSCEELKDFVETGTEFGMYYGAMAPTMAGRAEITVGEAAPTAEKSEDYSETTIQVEGVDEADIVKNDGKYIYVVSGEKVVIVDAYPAENSKILSEIKLNGNPQEIFINEDKLVVFGNKYYSEAFINVYDVSDRENPVIARNISLEGNYYDSRMIGDYVYAVISNPIAYAVGEDIRIPTLSVEGETKAVCNCPDVYYFDVPDYSYRFTTVMSINTQDDSEELTSKVFLIGYTQDMYVSLNNIYITYMKRLRQIDFLDKMIDEVFLPIVPSHIDTEIIKIKNSGINSYEKMQKIGEIIQNYSDSLTGSEKENFDMAILEKMTSFQQEIAKQMEKTVIHKISISDGNINYETNGEAPGNVLNQFSMDEFNGYFRIATTTGRFSMQSSQNHVYVLDSNLNIVGKVEDLAKGESIYSARFMMDRCYLVTFRQVDPLFVIDLSNPTNPQVLGFLKITGVSDYLHPYDETHIIGVGRDATEEGIMKGMKLSLFDVSDVSNPKEISKYIIGESGTDSEALRDHKAFLFSKSKNLLVIPIRLSEGGVWNAWQGAYVFNLDLTSGFVLKGRVTHSNETDYYYYDYSSRIRRSLYIDDVLYSISNKMIKMNDLEDLEEVNKVELPYEEEVYPRPLVEIVE